MPKCIATAKSTGSQCGCNAMIGEDYCHHHINYDGDNQDGCLSTTKSGSPCTKLGQAKYGGHCWIHRHVNSDVIDESKIKTQLLETLKKLEDINIKLRAQILTLENENKSLRMLLINKDKRISILKKQ